MAGVDAAEVPEVRPSEGGAPESATVEVGEGAGVATAKQAVASVVRLLPQTYVRRGPRSWRSPLYSPPEAAAVREPEEETSSPAKEVPVPTQSSSGERVNYDYSSDEVVSTEAVSRELVVPMLILQPPKLPASLSLVEETVDQAPQEVVGTHVPEVEIREQGEKMPESSIVPATETMTAYGGAPAA